MYELPKQAGLEPADVAEHQIRTVPAQLKLGHMVARANVPWSETPFPDETGWLVETLDQKKWLVEHCRWVVIDLRRSRNGFRPPARYAEPLFEPVPTIGEPIDALQTSSLGPAELRRAWTLYADLDQRTAAVLQSFHDQGRLDLDTINEVVGRLADVLPECLAGLIWLTRIKEPSQYNAQHVINTAILSMGLTYAMRWDRERIQTAGQVGMLHDIGKVRLSDDLLNKSGPLSDDDIRELRRHVIVAFDLLKTHRGMPIEVLAAVRSSHERPDGRGYPRGLSGNAIPVMARLIAVVDAYDAMAFDRPHSKAMTHQQALGELWRARGSQFEPKLVEALIQFLGWVPPGTLVRTSASELAVVMRMVREHGHVRPIVRIVERDNGEVSLAPELELAGELAGNTAECPSVSEILPDGHDGISMRALTSVLMNQYEAYEAQARQRQAAAEQGRSGGVGGWPRWRFSGLRRLFGTLDEPDVEAPETGLDPVLRQNVLIVDDALTVRELLTRALKHAGHSVETAGSGEEALERAAIRVPDVIFLDILLPGMNGFATLRQLRKNPSLAEVPVVVVSGSAQASDQFFHEKIGIDDFLPKPFAAQDVINCMQRLQARGRLRADQTQS